MPKIIEHNSDDNYADFIFQIYYIVTCRNCEQVWIKNVILHFNIFWILIQLVYTNNV